MEPKSWVHEKTKGERATLENEKNEAARKFGTLMGKIDKARRESKNRFAFSIGLQIITLITLILIGLSLL